MNIISLLKKSTVLPQLEANSKKEALDALISSLSAVVADDKELEIIRKAVFEREEIMSTGVGKGLAIPHGKADGITGNYAAFGLLETPVEYQAVDDNPVQMIFLLVGPQNSNRLHIKMLSRISRLMNNNQFRDELIECSSSKEIIDRFRKEEQIHFGN